MIWKLLTLLFVIGTTVAVPAQQTQPTSVNAADCSCGNYSIKSDVDMVKAGETVDFEVETKEQNVSTNQYVWIVSAGQIVTGHGTSKIKVQTFEGMETIVKPVQVPKGDPHGFIWSFPGKSWPKIEVSVRIIGKSCNCTLKSNDVSLGLRTIYKFVPADVADLSLSSDHLVLPCEPGQSPDEGKPSPSRTMLLDVATRSADLDDDPLVYVYKVSGGRIVGNGSNVQWDLSEAKAGTYTITAGVDDGCGVCGKTVSKTVTIDECSPPVPIYCPPPVISVSDENVGIPCAAGITTADNDCDNVSKIDVQISAVHPDGKKLTFQYSTSGGKVIGDDSTPVWDLTGLSPGTYDLKVIATGPDNYRVESVKTITIRYCECNQ